MKKSVFTSNTAAASNTASSSDKSLIPARSRRVVMVRRSEDGFAVTAQQGHPVRVARDLLGLRMHHRQQTRQLAQANWCQFQRGARERYHDGNGWKCSDRLGQIGQHLPGQLELQQFIGDDRQLLGRAWHTSARREQLTSAARQYGEDICCITTPLKWELRVARESVARF